MTFRKIMFDELEVIHKRRHKVQTRNSMVSLMVEEFTCGSQTDWLVEKLGSNRTFGIGKKEVKISNRWTVDGQLGLINGG
jgi:hypothetical protein